MTKAYLGINTSKDHKTRGRLIEMVIALSVGLLFALGIIVILTMGNWLLWEEDAMGDFNGYIVDATVEEFELLDENFDTGRKYVFGYNNRNEIIAHDEGFYKHFDYILVDGSFPTNKDEIVLSETALKEEGVSIGDRLILTITREDNTYDASFIVTGSIKDSKFNDLTKKIYLVSDDFRENNLYWEEIYVKKNILNGSLSKQLAEYNIDSERVRSMLGDGSMVMGIMLPSSFVALAILALAVTAISSIFTYSINERIRTIGLLKSIGTTSKQLKNAHLSDGYHHMKKGYLYGIIVGLVAFFMVIYLPLLLRGNMSINESLLANLHVDMYKVDSVWVLFGSMIVIVTILTFLTVRISVLIPFRKANKISIVECMRFQSIVSKRTSRNTSKISNTSIRLSIIHFMNNKSKSVLPTIMLSMSAALFIFFASFLNSMDSRILAESNFDGEVLVEGELSQDDVNQMAKLSNEYGVFGTKEVELSFEDIRYVNEEDYKTIDYLKEFYTRAPSKMISLNDLSFSEYEVEPLLENEVYLYDWRYEYILPESGEIEVYIDGVPITYKIKGFISTREIPTSSNGIPMIVINDEYAGFDMIYHKVFFYDDDQVGLSKQLKEMSNLYEVSTIDEYEESLKKENSMITSLGMGLLSVIGLISLVMIVNNVYTSVSSRKQEVAVMKSIGMTKEQLKRYFSVENYIYVVLTSIIAIPTGYILGKVVVDKLAEFNDHFEWHFQPLSILVIVLCYLVLSYVTNKTLKQHEKHSIAELVRE